MTSTTRAEVEQQWIRRMAVAIAEWTASPDGQQEILRAVDDARAYMLTKAMLRQLSHRDCETEYSI